MHPSMVLVLSCLAPAFWAAEPSPAEPAPELTSPLLSQPTASFTIKPLDVNGEHYDTDIATDKFEVLDVDFKNKRAAFRHIYRKRILVSREEDDRRVVKEFPVVDCGYPGMKEYPKSGVALGSYNLETDRMEKVFVVYKSVLDLGKCMTPEESRKALEDAKQCFLSAGLDINRKPAPILPPFVFPLPGGESVELEVESRRLTEDELRRFSSGPDEDLPYISAGIVWRGDEEVYVRLQEDSWRLTSGGTVEFVQAFQDGNQAVLLGRFRFHDSTIGLKDLEWFYFSGILRL
ncbi:MAG: hypothetical protein ABIG68_11850 [Acidobacteriota bacterium]